MVLGSQEAGAGAHCGPRSGSTSYVLGSGWTSRVLFIICFKLYTNRTLTCTEIQESC